MRHTFNSGIQDHSQVSILCVVPQAPASPTNNISSPLDAIFYSTHITWFFWVLLNHLRLLCHRLVRQACTLAVSVTMDISPCKEGKALANVSP